MYKYTSEREIAIRSRKKKKKEKWKKQKKEIHAYSWRKGTRVKIKRAAAFLRNHFLLADERRKKVEKMEKELRTPCYIITFEAVSTARSLFTARLPIDSAWYTLDIDKHARRVSCVARTRGSFYGGLYFRRQTWRSDARLQRCTRVGSTNSTFSNLFRGSSEAVLRGFNSFSLYLTKYRMLRQFIRLSHRVVIFFPSSTNFLSIIYQQFVKWNRTPLKMVIRMV